MADHDRHEAEAQARGLKMLASAALIVALTGPLWVPALFATVNIRADADRQAERNRQDIAALVTAGAAAERRLGSAEAVIQKLREDMARMEKAMAAMRAAFTGSAAADLGRSLRAGGRFAGELAGFGAVAPPAADLRAMLDAIAPYAEAGVPSGRGLRHRFGQHVSGGVMPAGGVSTIAWLRRGIGMASAAAPEEVNANLLEAEALLRDDDLLGAMAALRRIEPKPNWMVTWLRDAEARASADALLGRLDRMTQGEGVR
jgi:ATP phosphoribosyltransferase regulatory subunit HisZ